MDRLTSLLGFFSFYVFFAIINYLVNTPPKSLSGKRKWDFYGQHISLLHAVSAVLISAYIYITERGVHYNEATNIMHIISISVFSI